MKKILSGIKPTGELTLGNYLGAIKPLLKLQKQNILYLFVADLHALTINIDPQELIKNKRKIIAYYLAAGINPENNFLFFQSSIFAHAQLGWIFENHTTIGELSRMTQYKDKIHKQNIELKTGLLTYPALMAADILLYNPEYVAVGMDQKQHLELTKNIARRFNNKYGQTFCIPEIIMNETSKKIMSLNDPNKKMSKSSKSVNSYILLSDDPEKAFKKIMKAVTDSENKIYFSDQKPGIKNLLTIFASINDLSLKEVAIKFKDQNYHTLKTSVAQSVKNLLINLQKKYHYFLDKVEKIVEKNNQILQKQSQKNIIKIMQKIGLK